MLALFYLALGGVILTIGDLIMKKWVSSDDSKFYFAGILVYLLGLNFLATSFRYKSIAVASVLFIIFNIVSLAVVSYLMFDEKLSWLQVLGICLAFIAVLCLELG